MDDNQLGPDSQFFHRGDQCRISHDSAEKMRERDFDPKEVAEMVESGDYRSDRNRSYQGRFTLFGTLAGGRRVIVPYDRDDDDDKIDLVTAFGPDDPECKSFKTDRELKREIWTRSKSRRGRKRPRRGK